MKAIGKRRSARVTSAPRKLTLPASSGVDPGENLDQRRFARAVLAEQRENFAGVEAHADVAERLGAAKLLRHPAHDQQSLALRRRVFGRLRKRARGGDGLPASVHRG